MLPVGPQAARCRAVHERVGPTSLTASTRSSIVASGIPACSASARTSARAPERSSARSIGYAAASGGAGPSARTRRRTNEAWVGEEPAALQAGVLEHLGVGAERVLDDCLRQPPGVVRADHARVVGAVRHVGRSLVAHVGAHGRRPALGERLLGEDSRTPGAEARVALEIVHHRPEHRAVGGHRARRRRRSPRSPPPVRSSSRSQASLSGVAAASTRSSPRTPSRTNAATPSTKQAGPRTTALDGGCTCDRTSRAPGFGLHTLLLPEGPAPGTRRPDFNGRSTAWTRPRGSRPRRARPARDAGPPATRQGVERERGERDGGDAGGQRARLAQQQLAGLPHGAVARRWAVSWLAAASAAAA